jgi:hypothetical protein
MKSISSIENLTFGNKRPDLDLARGVFDDSWRSEFEVALDVELRNSTVHWSRDLVRAANFVSFYLPLRAKSIADYDVRNAIFKLHVQTETKLLTSLVEGVPEGILEALRSEFPLESADYEIIRLSLGCGNPIAATSEPSGIEKWHEAFKAQWRIVAPRLERTSCWDKWLVTAIRVASFYWDLLFMQNITMVECPNNDLAVLRPIVSPSTFAMISTFLHPPNIEIDDSGLPILGKPREFNGISVRRLVEPTLMARSNEKR